MLLDRVRCQRDARHRGTLTVAAAALECSLARDAGLLASRALVCEKRRFSPLAVRDSAAFVCRRCARPCPAGPAQLELRVAGGSVWGAQTRPRAQTSLSLDLDSAVRPARLRGHGILREAGRSARVS